jgi:hypothetical protein
MSGYQRSKFDLWLEQFIRAVVMVLAIIALVKYIWTR